MVNYVVYKFFPVQKNIGVNIYIYIYIKIFMSGQVSREGLPLSPRPKSNQILLFLQPPSLHFTLGPLPLSLSGWDAAKQHPGKWCRAVNLAAHYGNLRLESWPSNERFRLICMQFIFAQISSSAFTLGPFPHQASFSGFGCSTANPISPIAFCFRLM